MHDNAYFSIITLFERSKSLAPVSAMAMLRDAPLTQQLVQGFANAAIMLVAHYATDAVQPLTSIHGNREQGRLLKLTRELPADVSMMFEKRARIM